MSGKSGEQPLVLVADDERLNRELARTFLETAGYRVVETMNGTDALEQARALQPALALVDVRMHGMSGYEVCRALKADPATQHIKVIILSAQNRPADQAEARDAGADDYLYKLQDWGQIMRRIGELIADNLTL